MWFAYVHVWNVFASVCAIFQFNHIWGCSPSEMCTFFKKIIFPAGAKCSAGNIASIEYSSQEQSALRGIFNPSNIPRRALCACGEYFFLKKRKNKHTKNSFVQMKKTSKREKKNNSRSQALKIRPRKRMFWHPRSLSASLSISSGGFPSFVYTTTTMGVLHFENSPPRFRRQYKILHQEPHPTEKNSENHGNGHAIRSQ